MIKQLLTSVLTDLLVTVHTYVSRRNHCLTAIVNTCVTVLTVDLINTGVYFVRIEDWLLRHVVLLTTHFNTTVYHPVTGKDKHQDTHYRDEHFISFQRHILFIRNTLFSIGNFM
ncbi:hypothetical protein D3C87_1864450 [compost metagenome]